MINLRNTASMLGYDVRKYSLYLISLTAFITVYFTFGKPLILDRIVVGVFFVIALISFKLDKNIFSIICIFLIERTAEEIVWLFYDKQSFFLHLMAFLVLVVCFFTRKSSISQFVVGITILVECSYIYWFFTDYEAPNLGWGFMMYLESLFVLHALRHRVQIFQFIFIGEPGIKSLSIDKYLQNIAIAYIFLEAFRMMEYLGRHVLGQKELLVVYNLYAYIAQALTGVILWFIFNESWKMIKKTNLFA